MSAAEQHPATPTSGMWAPYVPPVIGEKLTVLEEVGEFVLVAVAVREGVATEYGPRDAVDLTVQTTDPETTRVFSGFAAGIVGQCKRIEAGNLPAACRIVKTDTGRGKTSSLDLIRLLPAGVSPADIAKHLAVPMMPIQAQTDDIPL